MKILIINQPLNNRGDESAHKALVRSLLYSIPNIHIVCLWMHANIDSVNQFKVDDDNVEYVCLQSKLPKVFRAFYNQFVLWGLKHNSYFLWNFHPAIRKIISYYKNSDYIICAPGGICMGGFQNWSHLAFLKYAQLSSKKIAYFGRSFGPFPTETDDNKKFKKLSLSFLRSFDFISIRDKKTETLANELGVNYISTLDTAFLDSTIVAIPNEINKLVNNRKYVVFVPNYLLWHYAYKNKATLQDVLMFYKGILDIYTKKFKDHLVLMLPQTFNYNNYDGDDILFFKDFKNFVNDDKLIVLNDSYSSDIQQAIIRNAECVVGARYHSVVFAINQHIPFVALSYEHKISGLLESLGLIDNMVDISNIFNGKDIWEGVYQSFDKAIVNIKPYHNASNYAKRVTKEAFDVCIDRIHSSCNL